MCLHPIYLRNPLWSGNHISKECPIKPIIVNPTFYDDPSVIAIPCGHCPECIALKQLYLVQRFQMEARNNHFFMCTLTYKNEMLPKYKIGEYTIPYADTTDFTKMMKRIKDYNMFSREIRYFAVSERGADDSKTHRPHYHAIFLVPKKQDDKYYDCLSLQGELYELIYNQWKRQIGGTRKKPVYEPLFEYHEKWHYGRLWRNYDLHYCQPYIGEKGISACAFYVIKYLLKENDYEKRLKTALMLNYDEKEYKEAWNYIKSKNVKSLGFGFDGRMIREQEMKWRLSKDEEITRYVKNCIHNSDKSQGFPQYTDYDTGKTFPLCKLYRQNVMTIKEAHEFYYATSIENVNRFECKTEQEYMNVIHDYQRKCELVDTRDQSYILDDLI